jgi:hypothetical protein
VRELADEFVRGGIGQLTEPAVAARLHRSDFERALDDLDTRVGHIVADPFYCMAICTCGTCSTAVRAACATEPAGTASSTGCTHCPRRHASMPTGLYAWCRVVAAIQALRHA